MPSLSDINSTNPTSAYIAYNSGSQLCFLMTPRLLSLSLNGEPPIEYFVKVTPLMRAAQNIGRSVTGSSSGSANFSSDPS